MIVAVAALGGVIVGVGLASLAWRKHTRSLREHVGLLKGQATATKEWAEASSETSARWKAVADVAQSEATTQRHEREVAERRLTILRDNMHREREA